MIAFAQELRQADLYKLPGVSETLDWVAALIALDREDLSDDIINDTLGALLKYQDDIQRISGSMAQRILSQVKK